MFRSVYNTIVPRGVATPPGHGLYQCPCFASVEPFDVEQRHWDRSLSFVK